MSTFLVGDHRLFQQRLPLPLRPWQPLNRRKRLFSHSHLLHHQLTAQGLRLRPFLATIPFSHYHRHHLPGLLIGGEGHHQPKLHLQIRMINFMKQRFRHLLHQQVELQITRITILLTIATLASFSDGHVFLNGAGLGRCFCIFFLFVFVT